MLKPRKRLVKTKIREDKLLVFTARVQGFASRNQRPILYVVGGVVVVAAFAGILVTSKASAERKAAYESFLARDAYSRGDLNEVITRTNTVIDDYAGTKGAAMALMLKGRVHEQLAEYEEAIQVYEELIRKYPGNDYLAFAAHLALGAIYKGRGDFLNAGRNYTDAAIKYPGHFDAPEALLDAGKSYRRAGAYDRARRTLRLVLSDHPKSRAATRARTELEDIEWLE
jgi:TolA-binding protein